jgi:CRISPR/Cas system-associated endoribonuclease Cas2
LTSTRSGMMIDSEVTAVIDEDRTHIRIIDANGKEQLKVRLIEPDIVLDEEVEV